VCRLYEGAREAAAEAIREECEDPAEPGQLTPAEANYGDRQVARELVELDFGAAA
jgi:hypothetical protein